MALPVLSFLPGALFHWDSAKRLARAGAAESNANLETLYLLWPGYGLLKLFKQSISGQQLVGCPLKSLLVKQHH